MKKTINFLLIFLLVFINTNWISLDAKGLNNNSINTANSKRFLVTSNLSENQKIFETGLNTTTSIKVKYNNIYETFNKSNKVNYQTLPVITTWVGYSDYGSQMIIANANGNIYGTIDSLYGNFNFNNFNGNLPLMRLNNQEVPQISSQKLKIAKRSFGNNQKHPKVQTNKTINLLITYSLDYLSEFQMTEEQFFAYLENAIIYLNSAVSNMNWDVNFNITGVEKVNFNSNKEYSIGDIMTMYANNDPQIGEITNLRDITEADLVYSFLSETTYLSAEQPTVLIPSPSAVATAIGALNINSNFAFSYVGDYNGTVNDIAPTYTMTHELGHLIGFQHDWSKLQGYTYNVGYNSGHYGTIMSYADTILPFFSDNEMLGYNGEVLGNDLADNNRYATERILDSSQTRLYKVANLFENRNAPTLDFGGYGHYLMDNHAQTSSTYLTIPQGQKFIDMNGAKVFSPIASDVSWENVGEKVNTNVPGYYQPIYKLTDTQGNVNYYYEYVLVTA